MGKGYNNYMCKKPFHPGSKANIKRAWMAEQKTENEKRKQEDLKTQYEKEQDLYNNKAMISSESKDKLELNFMYEAPPGAKRERQKEDDEPEFKFEWQRKYNAPREDYAKGNEDIKDQPFGIPVRNVRCIKCHKWGHINTDKECPLFHQASTSSMPTTSMDPMELMKQMKEDGFGLKEHVLGHQLNPAAANQQFIPSSESDPEMEFLKSLTTSDKKKLLRKLKKLSRKQKKSANCKKKKSKKSKKSKAKESSSSDSECDKKVRKKKKSKKSSSSSESESSSEDESSKKSKKRKKKHKQRGSSESPSKNNDKVKSSKDKKFADQSETNLIHEEKHERHKSADSKVNEKGKIDFSRDDETSSKSSSSHKKSKTTESGDIGKKGKSDLKQDDESSSRSSSSHKKLKTTESYDIEKKGCDDETSSRSSTLHKNLKTAAESEEVAGKHAKHESVETKQSRNEFIAKVKQERKSSSSDSSSEGEGDKSQLRKVDSIASRQDKEDTKKRRLEQSQSGENYEECKKRPRPDHPDGFSHLCPQALVYGNYVKAEKEYEGEEHDNFRHNNRDKRSPSVKQKYHQ